MAIPQPDESQARFLERHMPHQKALFAYLLAAVKDFQVAEDLLQEVTLALLKNFGAYRESEPYLRWAFGTARHILARYFRDRPREVRLNLEILEYATDPIVENETRLSAESQALEGCLKKLDGRHRQLVRLRYEEGLSLGALAERLGQSVAALNMALVRTRRALAGCTKRALAPER